MKKSSNIFKDIFSSSFYFLGNTNFKNDHLLLEKKWKPLYNYCLDGNWSDFSDKLVLEIKEKKSFFDIYEI